MSGSDHDDAESMSGDEGKFQFETEASKLDELPPEVQRRVKALKNIMLANVKHEVEYYKELHQLDLKYQKLYEENNARRKEICLGSYEPTASECEWIDMKDDVAEKLGKLNLESRKETVGGIPDFWLKVFQHANEDVLHGTMEQIDEPILKYLEDVRVSLPETNDGFTLNFHFADNEFFSNKVLIKEYQLRNDYDKDDPLDFDGPEVIKSSSFKIDWKPGKNPCVKIIKKKTKSKVKGKGGPKFVTKEEKRDSFFHFFNPPANEDDEDADLLHEDYDIGINIKEKLIPKAVLYFTGEAETVDYDEFEDEDDEDFLDSEDD